MEIKTYICIIKAIITMAASVIVVTSIDMVDPETNNASKCAALKMCNLENFQKALQDML